MTAQRMAGLALLAVSGATLAYTSHRPMVPACAILVGLVGAMRWVRLRMSRTWELIVVLVLAGAFAMFMRTDPAQAREARGFFLYSFAHTLGEFLLVAMAFGFLLARTDRLPAMLPLPAVAVMVCAGDVYVTEAQDRVFQMLSLTLACVTGLYFAASRRRVDRAPRQLHAGRAAAVLAALVVAVAAGKTASALLQQYERQVSRLLMAVSLEVESLENLGFSRDARLGSLMRRKHHAWSDLPALRVFSQRQPGYLRGMVYHKYTRSAWRQAGRRDIRSPGAGVPEDLPRAPSGANTFRVHRAGGRKWHTYDIWPEPEVADAIFVPMHTAYISADASELLVDESGAANATDLPPGAGYTAFVPDSPSPRPLTEALRDKYTSLPLLDARVVDLAEKIFAGKDTTAEKVAAVEQYFRRNYEYELGIRIPRRQDPLTYFLVEKPAAHCEYFATAAAVLLRLGGVPARYVAGFVVQERSALGGYWLGRYKDAHAWVEAYDAGRGWVIVEATPPAGVPGAREGGLLGQFWDYTKFRFRQLRAMIDADGVKGLLLWCWRRLAGLAALLVTTLVGRIVSGVLVLAAAAVLIRRLRRRPRRAKIDPLVAGMHRALRAMDRRCGRRGLVRRPGETLHQFSRRIAEPPAEQADRRAGLAQASAWYIQYARLRYGTSRSPDSVTKLREEMPLV